MAIHWVEEKIDNIDNKYQISYSVAGGEVWIEAEISTRGFGDTKSKVFSVDLTNLKADTRYAFKISSDKKSLGKWFFKTAPLKIEMKSLLSQEEICFIPENY